MILVEHADFLSDKSISYNTVHFSILKLQYWLILRIAKPASHELVRYKWLGFSETYKTESRLGLANRK